MTQEQKRIKLAEAGGIKHGVKCSYTDYFNNLNAVHELEKVLTDEQWLEYREELRTFSLGPIRLISQCCKADIHATASHRAEALGLVLNLW